MDSSGDKIYQTDNGLQYKITIDFGLVLNVEIGMKTKSKVVNLTVHEVYKTVIRDHPKASNK